ncbi:hypothetical protein B0181_06085 [Moraxella caviae]|uniref:Lipoprotein n=1 Tax=Moraxella caviae TaxID=34060 RepID=A0A1T0A247_9GAMM|nr:hypothetical protein [Moraxella caviae]OOR89775.1 hypothetical protein B0181_06085 [Moraxella caviae]STZ10716.1 Uncharacterised protein [Moraxella caviae]VEW11840.1 Uncharacterised protein [Moraxella caviae]
MKTVSRSIFLDSFTAWQKSALVCAFAVLTLSACGNKESEVQTPDPVEEEAVPMSAAPADPVIEPIEGEQAQMEIDDALDDFDGETADNADDTQDAEDDNEADVVESVDEDAQ